MNDWRNWDPHPQGPIRGTLPDLGKDTSKGILGGLMDSLHSLQLQRDKITQSIPYQLFVDRNPDNALTNLLGNVPSLRNSIGDGRLNFHLEVPGYNSNRAFLGFTYNLRK